MPQVKGLIKVDLLLYGRNLRLSLKLNYVVRAGIVQTANNFDKSVKQFPLFYFAFSCQLTGRVNPLSIV